MKKLYIILEISIVRLADDPYIHVTLKEFLNLHMRFFL